MKRNQIFILTLALLGAVFVFDGFAQQAADSLAWQHRGTKGQGKGNQTTVQNQSTDDALQNGSMNRSGFTDVNGDGLNDRDADGDGVPNGQDPDYVRGGNKQAASGECINDGTGSSRQHGGGKGQGGGRNR